MIVDADSLIYFLVFFAIPKPNILRALNWDVEQNHRLLYIFETGDKRNRLGDKLGCLVSRNSDKLACGTGETFMKKTTQYLSSF